MNDKILFIYPKLGFDVKDVSFELPMGYLCMAAPLKADGFDVQIIDQRIEKNFDLSLRRALKEKPLLIGLSMMTGQQITHSLNIAGEIREIQPEATIVFGGVHPTLMPDQTLLHPLVDLIVRGEGEQTILELAQALRSDSDFSGIEGLSYTHDSEIVHTPERPPIDLNTQPPIPYELVDVDKYLMGQIPGYRRSLDVYTSRGCPCACIYCYNQSFNKRRWRPISTERILENIRYLIDKFRIDSMFFNDDNMFVSLPRVYEICEGLHELPYVPVWGSVGSRVDSLHGCDYDKLEKSGCKHLYIGIESGSERILNQIKKGITLDQTLDVVRDISRTDIIAHYNFMTGFPMETGIDLKDTLDFIDQIMTIDRRAYISSLHIATPYPGTPYYFMAQEYGWKPPDSLEEWSDIYWEKTEMPWLDKDYKRMLSNISIISYFIDHKVADRLQGRPLFLAGVWLYGKLAGFRWKHRKFNFCPEFQLLKRLNEWSILE